MKGKMWWTMALSALCLGIAITSALNAEPRKPQAPEPQEVTLTGTVVDLQCFMTGQYLSADHEKCTKECIRAGVPVALETPEGLYILGHGMEGPARMFNKLGMCQVEVKGMLHEKLGVRYIDVATARELEQTSRPFWKEDEGDSSDTSEDMEDEG
jgi:hypothetical protein